MCNDDEIKYHKEENNNDNENKKSGTCTTTPPPPYIEYKSYDFFFLNQDMSMHLFFWANHIYISENEKN